MGRNFIFRILEHEARYTTQKRSVETPGFLELENQRPCSSPSNELQRLNKASLVHDMDPFAGGGSFHHYVNQAMVELDLSQATRIAVDETSSHCGHRYITLFVDVDTKRVPFATEGKGRIR
ncbi:hypothetical protein ASD24_22310 [Paenibacillus sp. Root52]|nr:hypothetical protein ASD24_22310 [Paenibacillus sp. Root52]